MGSGGPAGTADQVDTALSAFPRTSKAVRRANVEASMVKKERVTEECAEVEVR